MKYAKYNATLKTAQASYIKYENCSSVELQNLLTKGVKEAYGIEYKIGKQTIWELNRRPTNVNKFLRSIITIEMLGD